ncbi:hypothetical protein CAI21_10390 [Alkalilimnicola ehrlichii]|uniref:Uncharacterized protein n=1 Tax=Alkalilimnicola ehrlichii TaxID=351052 RepID=A0A3E0WSX7_9GAMM|nr:hypothetical protein [Alkalilimnicola ehrlichii]RFA29169.1 hypothetical protein CAI21_10390 [Alkalilimnicola ehrlichii]RFA36082.1 hypothetical protein CAL65_11540 [Alkalilimnicola ehrlichii]
MGERKHVLRVESIRGATIRLLTADNRPVDVPAKTLRGDICPGDLVYLSAEGLSFAVTPAPAGARAATFGEMMGRG